MKKRLFLLRCLTAAAISLTFLLTLAACGVQSASNTGDNTASSTDLAQIEINLDGESFLEAVFSQPTSDGRGRITYYRNRVTDVLYMNVFCKSATGYAGAGGLTAVLEGETVTLNETCICPKDIYEGTTAFLESNVRKQV